MSLIVDTEVIQLDIDEAWNDSVTTDKMIFHKNSNGPKLPLKTLQEKDVLQELKRPKVTIKDTARKMISYKKSTGPELPLKTLQEKWHSTRTQTAQSYH